MYKNNISNSRIGANRKRPSLVINAMSNWAALIITAAAGFFLTPYIISHLGKMGFGIWTLVASIIGYYGLLDLGVSSAITRYVARYAALKDYNALNQIISAALAMFCVIGFVVVGLSFALAGPLASLFNVPADQVREFRHLVWLLGLVAGLGFPGNLFGAVVRAHERFVAANCVRIIITLIRATLIVVTLSHGMGFVGIGYSYLATTFVIIALNFAMCKILFSHFRPNFMLASWNVVRVVLGYGAVTTVAVLADILRFDLDSFVIGKWIGLPEVGVYGIAALLVRYMLQFITAGTQAVLTPRFAAIDGEGNWEQLQQLFLKSLSVAAVLSFAALTLVIVLGRQFIVFWVGQGFIDAVPVLSLLAISYAFALAQNPAISAMYALKKHHFFAACSVVEGIGNLSLSIYLAPRMGILGVAIGTAVPMLVVKLFAQPIYVSRIIGVSLIGYWTRLAPASGLAALLVLVSSCLPQGKGFDTGFVSLVFCGMPFVAPFALLYFLTDVIIPKMYSPRLGNQ